jgi:hypothetical protein
MDLREAFDEIAGKTVAPTIQQADADLTRGRGALRRRRVWQAAGGSVFVVAAMVAVAAVITAGPATGPAGVQALRTPASSAPGIHLVAYKGKQPAGFTIDKMPEGWFIQTVNDYYLMIAPNWARSPGPGVDPSKSPVYDPSFTTGKISISLESRDAKHGVIPQNLAVKVGAAQGYFFQGERQPVADENGSLHLEPVRPDGDYGAGVVVKQPSGIYLEVNFAEGLGFTKQQMIELAAGVHVHKNAKQGAG